MHVLILGRRLDGIDIAADQNLEKGCLHLGVDGDAQDMNQSLVLSAMDKS